MSHAEHAQSSEARSPSSFFFLQMRLTFFFFQSFFSFLRSTHSQSWVGFPERCHDAESSQIVGARSEPLDVVGARTNDVVGAGLGSGPAAPGTVKVTAAEAPKAPSWSQTVSP